MHELSICRAIADTVTKAAEGRSVTCVRLKVGHFRQIVPATLQFCWDLHNENGPLAGSTLEVDSIAATIVCATCGHRTTLHQPILICAACSGQDVQLLTGEEFLIESFDVEPHHISTITSTTASNEESF